MPLTGAGMRRHVHLATMPPKASSASSPCSAARSCAGRSVSLPPSKSARSCQRRFRLRCSTAAPCAAATVADGATAALACTDMDATKPRRRSTQRSHARGRDRRRSGTPIRSSCVALRARRLEYRARVARDRGPAADDSRGLVTPSASADRMRRCSTPVDATQLPRLARSIAALSDRSQRRILAPATVRRTPGISCEAVPASCRCGAGMRRHLHAGTACRRYRRSFVSFIPLFGAPSLLARVVASSRAAARCVRSPVRRRHSHLRDPRTGRRGTGGAVAVPVAPACAATLAAWQAHIDRENAATTPRGDRVAACDGRRSPEPASAGHSIARARDQLHRHGSPRPARQAPRPLRRSARPLSLRAARTSCTSGSVTP